MRRASLLAMALVAAFAPAAHATYPGANGRIAFVGEARDAQYVTSLYTVDWHGGPAANLTGARGEDQAPYWYADGRQLVYERRAGDGASIFAIAADAMSGRQVTTGPDHLAPAVSPDGRTIVFSRYDGRFRLYAVDADGSNERKLIDDGHKASFSPDGRTIVFESQRQYRDWGKTVFAMDADGTDERPLARGEAPSFSPDGSRVIFQAGQSIHVVDADGTDERPLPLSGTDPVFSPDGRKIASGWHGKVVVANADGSGRAEIVADVGSIPLGPDPSWQPLPDTPCAGGYTGTNAADRLLGTRYGDRLFGLGGADVLAGGAGDDCLDGGRGNDRVRGGAGQDRLRGGSGADVLIDVNGVDTLRGDSGDDRIDTRDRDRDVVSCGPGRDRALVDHSDAVSGCERVVRDL